MERNTFSNPLPGVALGDPFVLRHRGRFYLYGTNDGPPLPHGRVVPVFRSDDLLHWEALGGALEPLDPTAEHWAPEVMYWNGRFSMIVSFGDVDRRGHALWVATADRPEGPFRLAKQVSDPSERFSIDGAWLLDDDGRLYLYRCLDFIEEGDPPHGTGIVVQPMRDPLTPSGPPVPVLRAHAPWQLFEANRVMPLYGGRTFAEWTTIEGAAPVRRAGRVFCGYSGGNYQFAYGTGEAVADEPLGPYTDLHGREGPIFATTPGLVEGPGHFSVVRPDLVHDWIVLHGRAPGEGVRRVWLCPADWTRDGVRIGPLTDQPQPAPPLPTYLFRFDGLPGSTPDGWQFLEGDWSCDGEGLRHRGPERGRAFMEQVEGAIEWSLQADVRFPGPGPGATGVTLCLSDRTRLTAGIDAGRLESFFGNEMAPFGSPGLSRSALPTLGPEPFHPDAWHSITIHSHSGVAEVRIDGVVAGFVGHDPGAFFRGLHLIAHGAAVFDAVALTTRGGKK